MASARRISGSASARRLVACSSCARLLRSLATLGCSGAEARLVDGQRPPHQRLGLGQAVGGLEQLRQVVEVGWRRWDAPAPKLASSMASARRISGSASARRLVALQQLRQVVEVEGDVGVVGAEARPRRWPAPGASAARPRPGGWWLCSSCARLLRSRWRRWDDPAPKLASSMASARRISGSASAWRDFRKVHHTQLIHQPGGGRGDPGRIGVPGHCLCVRQQGIRGPANRAHPPDHRRRRHQASAALRSGGCVPGRRTGGG